MNGESLGMREASAFQRTIAELLGDEDFGPEVCGDLSFLLRHFERGSRVLSELMQGGDREQMRKRFLELEILLRDDLPRSNADLLPALASIRRRAYGEEGPDEWP